MRMAVPWPPRLNRRVASVCGPRAKSKNSIPNQAEGIVHTAFGEPDRAEGGAWVYENIQVGTAVAAIAHEVEFTFQSGKVKTVKVAVAPKKETP